MASWPTTCVTPAAVRALRHFVRVTNPEQCWLWTGARTKAGYAVIGGCPTDGGRLLLAHRVLYEAEVGPIPDGVQLDHFVCDNGAGGCVRPSHCRPASARENLLRSDLTHAARNAAKSHCDHGHPFDETNTRLMSDGERRCRACEYNRRKRWRENNRQRENMLQQQRRAAQRQL